MEQDSKCPFVPTIDQHSAKMMEGKSRYCKDQVDGEGLRDSQGNLEPPETIHQ